MCDKPGDAAAASVLKALEAAHQDDPMVRIRCNGANVGAGPTRNTGLAESAADWVLFLDDDVEPSPDILEAYANAIRQHPRATGFIGYSELPLPSTARQAGVHIAGIAYFWAIAMSEPTQTELPWGVTANLCVRRAPLHAVAFNATFPKTGGGEDIDYCFRMREYVRSLFLPGESEGFVAVPDAKITHPWWDNGKPDYWHFEGWARGDGHLIDLYPQHTYRNLPDLAETLGVLGLVLLVQLGAWMAMSITAAPFWYPAVSVYGMVVTLIIAAGCIGGDLAIEFWHLATNPLPEIMHLALRTRILAVFQGVFIRTVSEAGRLRGHAQRGRLLHNICRRFNWFGAMWDGAPAQERKQACIRTAVRIATVGAFMVLSGCMPRYRAVAPHPPAEPPYSHFEL